MRQALFCIYFEIVFSSGCPQTSYAAENDVELLLIFLYLPNVDVIDLCPVLHSAGDQTPAYSTLCLTGKHPPNDLHPWALTGTQTHHG